MKNLFLSLCLLALSIFSGCFLESNCPDIETDANFIVKAQDFYTNEPIKGRLMRFDRVDSRNVLANLTTNDSGVANLKVKFTTFCDQGHSTVLNLIQSDTSDFFPVKVTPKCSFEVSKGDVNISVLYKKRSANLLLKIVHKDSLNNSLKMVIRKPNNNNLCIPFDAGFNFNFYEEFFNTTAPNETTRLIKILPQEETYINYSYFNGGKQIFKSDYIWAGNTDTLKFTITY